MDTRKDSAHQHAKKESAVRLARFGYTQAKGTEGKSTFGRFSVEITKQSVVQETDAHEQEPAENPTVTVSILCEGKLVLRASGPSKPKGAVDRIEDWTFETVEHEDFRELLFEWRNEAKQRSFDPSTYAAVNAGRIAKQTAKDQEKLAEFRSTSQGQKTSKQL